MTDKIITNTSDEAAHKVDNINGWVSRDGLFFGVDERAARYAGCTHVECGDCQKPTRKGYLYCPDCMEIRRKKKYAAFDVVEWDGTTPLSIYMDDVYFFSEDEIEDYCEEHSVQSEELMLVLCEPNKAEPIDAETVYCDDLPPEGEIPANLQEAFDELNAKIRAMDVTLSWWPTKKAVEIEGTSKRPPNPPQTPCAGTATGAWSNTN